MYLPKARRGRVRAKCYVIRINGRFKEIPKGVYDQLKEEKEEVEYTEAQIDQMVEAYNRHVNNLQQQVNTVKSSMQQSQPQQNNNNSHLKTPWGS